MLIKRRNNPLFTLWELKGSWIPFTHGCFVPNWLKSAQQFWRRFLNFIKVFWLFHNFLPLKKGRALHLHKIESSSPKEVLCQVWLKLAQRFWRRRWKCEKFKTRPTTTKTTDYRHIFIRKAHLSLRLRWANKKYKHSILVLDNSTVLSYHQNTNFLWRL